MLPRESAAFEREIAIQDGWLRKRTSWWPILRGESQLSQGELTRVGAGRPCTWADAIAAPTVVISALTGVEAAPTVV
jgi:hypothetical protein